MWIDSLSLRNFRGFRELEIDLRRQLTVLIGVNGSGKSTVVHALRALPRFLTAGTRTRRQLEERAKQFDTPDGNGRLESYVGVTVAWLQKHARTRSK